MRQHFHQTHITLLTTNHPSLPTGRLLDLHRPPHKRNPRHNPPSTTPPPQRSHRPSTNLPHPRRPPPGPLNTKHPRKDAQPQQPFWPRHRRRRTSRPAPSPRRSRPRHDPRTIPFTIGTSNRQTRPQRFRTHGSRPLATSAWDQELDHHGRDDGCMRQQHDERSQRSRVRLCDSRGLHCCVDRGGA